MMTAAARRRADELDDLTFRRAQLGDTAAFRVLVEWHHVAVWNLASRLLYGTAVAHRAEDVVQDTFLRVYRALASFDPAGTARLSTWICTIATRLALNELRALPRARERVELGAIADLASTDSPARTLAARRRSAAVGRAIASLPEHSRAVVILREYHDLDYDEIAAALVIDLGTVKSRLSRARRQLRDQLAGFAAGDDHV
jgi:RNA polymerase sigma-70 factor (ECF subfamily)